MEKSSKIYIAGHQGMVGSALYEELKRRKYNNLLIKPLEELDLRNQKDTFKFVVKGKPEYIFLIAGKV